MSAREAQPRQQRVERPEEARGRGGSTFACRAFGSTSPSGRVAELRRRSPERRPRVAQRHARPLREVAVAGRSVADEVARASSASAAVAVDGGRGCRSSRGRGRRPAPVRPSARARRSRAGRRASAGGRAPARPVGTPAPAMRSRSCAAGERAFIGEASRRSRPRRAPQRRASHPPARVGGRSRRRAAVS